MFKIKINNKELLLEEKVQIKDLIPYDEQKNYFVAKVNNRLRELTYELCYDADVELLSLNYSDAVKVYEASFRYLLCMAFHNLYPNYQIKLSYNISRSILVSIIEPDGIIMDSRMLKNIIKELNRIVEEDYPIDKLIMSKEEAYDYFVKSKEIDKANLLKYRPDKVCHFYKCDNYLNYMLGYLVPSTGYIKKFNLFCYDSQFIAQYPRAEYKGEIPPFNDEPVFSKVLKKAYCWARICNTELVSKMNDHIGESTYVDFINMNETLHNDMLHELGNKIEEDIDNIRLICIAGPSSSGKTTFSNRLRIELMARNIVPIRISLDMYYKPREECPKDENGKYDFEDINALDLDLFNEHMLALINGEKVRLPIFNFKTGQKEEGEEVQLGPRTPIIIEGIHALNDKLSYSIPKHQKFKIFIAPQFQLNVDYHNPISYTDIRLLRRIVRDKKYRGTSAERTLEMWSSVRKGEFKWIYPYQEGCNYVYNSALTYELCILKKYALPALKEVPNDSPYYIMANRLIKFLKYFKDMDDTWVPCNSLLREFIGGSCFQDVEE